MPRTGGGCLLDADCTTSDVCSSHRCVVGACVRISSTVDADGDLHGAAPECGDDCDDANANVFPSAGETCDFVDEDCDGAIDENARKTLVGLTIATRDEHMVLSRWGDRFIVTDAASTPGRVRLRRLQSGTVGALEPTSVLDIEGTLEGVDVEETERGLIAAVMSSDPAGRRIDLVEVERAEDGSVGTRRSLGRVAVPAPSEFALAVDEGTPAVAWDDSTARYVWSPGWDAPVALERAAERGDRLDLALAADRVFVAVSPSSIEQLSLTDGQRLESIDTGAALVFGAPLAARGSALAFATFERDLRITVRPLDGEPPSTRGPYRDGTIDRTSSCELHWEVRDAALICSYAEGRSALVLSPTTWSVEDNLDLFSEHFGEAGPVQFAQSDDQLVFLANFGQSGAELDILACRRPSSSGE